MENSVRTFVKKISKVTKVFFSFLSKNHQLGNLFAVALITLVIPFTVFVASQNELLDLRQRAQEVPNASEDQDACNSAVEQEGEYYNFKTVFAYTDDNGASCWNDYEIKSPDCSYEVVDTRCDDPPEELTSDEEEPTSVPEEEAIPEPEPTVLACQDESQGNVNKCAAGDESGYNAAGCCGADSDCNEGEACSVGNGYCASGISCGQRGTRNACTEDPNSDACINKLNVNGDFDPACCVLDNECSDGQSCSVGNGYCASGNSCGEPVVEEPTAAPEEEEPTQTPEEPTAAPEEEEPTQTPEEPTATPIPEIENPTISYQPSENECTPNTRYCNDTNTAEVSCEYDQERSKYVEVRTGCVGYQACQPESASCESRETTTSPCGVLSAGESTCSSDGDQKLTCNGLGFDSEPCSSCSTESGKVSCEIASQQRSVEEQPDVTYDCTNPEASIGEYVCDPNGKMWNVCDKNLIYPTINGNGKWRQGAVYQACTPGERSKNPSAGEIYVPTPTPTFVVPTSTPFPTAQSCSFQGGDVTVDPYQTKCIESENGSAASYSCIVMDASQRTQGKYESCAYGCNAAKTGCETTKPVVAQSNLEKVCGNLQVQSLRKVCVDGNIYECNASSIPSNPIENCGDRGCSGSVCNSGDACENKSPNSSFCNDTLDGYTVCGVRKIDHTVSCGSGQQCSRNALTGTIGCTDVPTPTVAPVCTGPDGAIGERVCKKSAISFNKMVGAECVKEEGAFRTTAVWKEDANLTDAYCPKPTPIPTVAPTPVVVSGCTYSWVGGEPQISGSMWSTACGSNGSSYVCKGGSVGVSGWQQSQNCRASGKQCDFRSGTCYTPTMPTTTTVQCNKYVDDIWIPCASNQNAE